MEPMMKNVMTRRNFLRSSLIAASGLCLGGRAWSARADRSRDRRPNIVLIVSDDQGYADSSCYDHPKEVGTPNIDRLAAEGVRLTNGYASACVCAPTRAGLMTGRYQQRFGFYTAPDSRVGMPLGEITVADLLRKEGYATAVVGKWHLGLEPEYRPLKRGFDEFYGFLGHGGHDYFNLDITDEYTSIYRNEKPINDTGYLTNNLARESVSFIERNRNRPFFLYLPFNAVHWPLQALPEHIERFNTGDTSRDIYLAMLLCMDQAVGRVLEALERTGADENTLIVFFSDNGGARKNLASNGVLRDYKHSLYEGGIRVPFMVRWPDRLPKGAVCDEPVISLDVMPTICAAAGITLQGDRVYDGRNMLPALRGRLKGALHEKLFWDDGADLWAVRAGRWKLICVKGSPELYDLLADISEKNDLSKQNPDVVERLERYYRVWKSEMAPRIQKVRDSQAAGRRTKEKKKR
ncbi:MAG: sulfatase [Phycisphaerales bacterium]|nr:MAG: sulfatase [Phycisphaerales bacterium]